ncbi:MAG: TIGR03915 family putative DNA repair protein, partial [Clostridia bacterium]|nr:TIGR03915 family putative DNA repair protein [Clostridia bacterium]
VYFHYYHDKANNIFERSNYQPNLMVSCYEVYTDLSMADKVYKAIEKKISPYDLQRIYKVFRSNAPNREILLLNYIRFGFKVGSKLSLLHGNAYVSPVEKLERAFSTEIHRMIELLRFSVLEGNILYAVFEPDHDVLEFLWKHFTDRFKHESFIIHDKKRGKALLYHDEDWYISEFSDELLLSYAKEEDHYRKLWKQYFDSIAIKERTNPRCQRNFMPARYWKHLTEMNCSNNYT